MDELLIQCYSFYSFYAIEIENSKAYSTSV